MQVIIIWVIIILVINKLKKKAKASEGQSAGSRNYQRGTVARTRQTVYTGAERLMRTDGGRSMRTGASSKTMSFEIARQQESWRNTAEVTRSDISFRNLRPGEDELAYLIRRNTAYEKLLEDRLVSRDA